jgi:DNA segregation ATPase FtsK/SpoIIIE, S-DNA-T family
MAEKTKSGKSKLGKKKPVKKGSGKGTLTKLIKDERFPVIMGLLFILLSLFLLIAFTSHLFAWKSDQSLFANLDSPWNKLFDNSIQTANKSGRLGAILSHQFFYSWIGISSYLFVVLLFTMGMNFLLKKSLFPLRKIFRHTLVLMAILPPVLNYIFGNSSFPFGGGYGLAIDDWLINFIGNIGTGMFLVFMVLVYLVLTFNLSFAKLANIGFRKKQKPGQEGESAAEVELPKNPYVREDLEYGKNEAFDSTIVKNEEEQTDTLIEVDNSIPLDMEKGTPEGKTKSTEKEGEGLELKIEPTKTEEAVKTSKAVSENFDPTLDLSKYKYPTLDLLEDYGQHTISIDKAELEKNKDQIIETLENYNIKISKIKATVGPTVTLYEIVPAPGVRISKIKNLEDDIALSLAALGIRIIAPIPGKGTIGIEVPNKKKEIVGIRTLLGSDKFVHSKMDLPIALGKTIANENYIADLAKMPHLLMAGATGQGKSVGINAVLMSLLYKKHPSQLKFILIDPKKVELSLFKHLEKHFLAKLPGDGDAIITDTKKVVSTLNSLSMLMDSRYNLLKEAHVRNIKEYNTKFIERKLNPEKGHKFMPYIVLVVDEFADLMMTAGKEIEAPIARLAQLARAVGIHLIIATQRPSVNIITGTIKANFPARVAFKVTSKVDSRTILDISGADQLIGRGDMLLSVGGHIVRLQCAFVDTHEVEKVTDFIGDQQGYTDAYMLPEVAEDAEGGASALSKDERDDYFEEAAHLVVLHQQGSTSLIQRKLKLGYNRAGRIIDQLEQAGIVGPHEGSKAREVYYKTSYDLEQFLNQEP